MQPYYSILRKYWKELKDLDVSSLVQISLDLIDSSLTKKEVYDILDNFFRGQCLGVEHLDYEHYPQEDLENPVIDVLEDLDGLIEVVKELKDKLVRLEKEREALSNMLNGLLYVKGHIERKWVKNKIGKRYYYYYLRYVEGGRKRSVYLGKEIPPEVKEKIANYEQFRRIVNRLKEIDQKEQQIREIVRKIMKEVDKI